MAMLSLPMQIFRFASDSYRISASTSDATGGNLPANYAPWRAVNDGNALVVGAKTDPVAMAVTRNGYFLTTRQPRQKSKVVLQGS
jgi:hypothetical protein